MCLCHLDFQTRTSSFPSPRLPSFSSFDLISLRFPSSFYSQADRLPLSLLQESRTRRSPRSSRLRTLRRELEHSRSASPLLPSFVHGLSHLVQADLLSSYASLSGPHFRYHRDLPGAYSHLPGGVGASLPPSLHLSSFFPSTRAHFPSSVLWLVFLFHRRSTSWRTSLSERSSPLLVRFLRSRFVSNRTKLTSFSFSFPLRR